MQLHSSTYPTPYAMPPNNKHQQQQQQTTNFTTHASVTHLTLVTMRGSALKYAYTFLLTKYFKSNAVIFKSLVGFSKVKGVILGELLMDQHVFVLRVNFRTIIVVQSNNNKLIHIKPVTLSTDLLAIFYQRRYPYSRRLLY